MYSSEAFRYAHAFALKSFPSRGATSRIGEYRRSGNAAGLIYEVYAGLVRDDCAELIS